MTRPYGTPDDARGLAPMVAALLVATGFVTRLAYGWEWDELELLHAASAVARGLVPYRDFFEHHAPLMSLVLAPVARGGDGAATVLFVPARFLATGVLVGILVALARLMRHVVGAPAAAWATVVFLVVCPTAGKLFELRADWPALVLLLLGIESVVTETRPTGRGGLVAGLLGGTALCLTQKAFVPWSALLTWAVAGLVRTEGRRDVSRRAIGLVMGTMFFPLLVTGAFAYFGAAQNLFDGVIGINVDWPRELPWERSWELASPEASGALAIAAAAAVGAWRSRGPTASHARLLSLLAAAGLAAFVTTPVPWEQAFLFFVAPWVAGLVVLGVEGWLSAGGSRSSEAWVAVGVLLLGLFVLPQVMALRLASAWVGVSIMMVLLVKARDLGRSVRMQAVLGAAVLPGIVLFAGDRMHDAVSGRHRAQASFARRVSASLRPEEPVLALWDHVLPFRPSPTYHWFAHQGVLGRVGATRLDSEYVDALADGRVRVVIADVQALDGSLPRLQAYMMHHCAPLAPGYAGSDAYSCGEVRDDTPAARRPPDPQTLVAAAKVRLATGDFDQGTDLLRRALTLLPADSAPGRAVANELSAARDSHGRPAAPAGATNVLLIIVDTLRADHVGAYGYARPTTPAIDALATGGVVFETVVSQAPWTAASAATLLTGLYPSVHGLDGGVEWLGGAAGPGGLPFAVHRALASSRHTLAEVLRARGWQTAGFVSNVYMSALLGLAQGFDVWADEHDDYADNVLTRKRRASRTNAAVFRWLDQVREPFFALVHYNDPHWPYDPPAPFGREWTAGYAGPLTPGASAVVVESEGRQVELSREDLAYLIGLYDGEICYTDSEIARLLERVKGRGFTRGLLTIVTADHGEEFLDHGSMSHGYTLYDEQLRVPLVLHFPGHLASRRVAAQVRLVDVVPTVLDLLGLPALPEAQGISLGPLAEGRTTVGPGAAFAEATLRERLAMIRTSEGRKLIEDLAGATGLFFDLARDPGESHPLGSSLESERRGLREQLASWGEHNRRLRARQGEDDATGRTTLDADTRRRLEALGYLR